MVTCLDPGDPAPVTSQVSHRVSSDWGEGGVRLLVPDRPGYSPDPPPYKTRFSETSPVDSQGDSGRPRNRLGWGSAPSING